MAELALDQRQGEAVVEQLDGVGMAELVRSEPPPNSASVRWDEDERLVDAGPQMPARLTA